MFLSLIKMEEETEDIDKKKKRVKSNLFYRSILNYTIHR